MFDQSGAALDPVTVIDVEDTIHVSHLGMMDVAAHDTIEA